MTADRPNVLLVVLDTARASAFEGYGRTEGTPAFESLARDGLLCRRAIATSPWTLPSHVSLFGGQMPSEHGVMGDAWSPGSVPSVRPLIERIGDRWLTVAAKRAGYETFAAVANMWVGRRTGFDHAFDRFVSRRGDVADAPAAGSGGNRRAPDTVRRARRRLSAHLRLHRGNRDSGARQIVADFDAWLPRRPRGAPFFAFLNLMEPHAPYVPPRRFQRLETRERFRAGQLAARLHHSPDLMLPFNVGLRSLEETDLSILRRLYEGEVSCADEAVGVLVETLERGGELDRTVIVVTSDHGENLGEHHLLAHNMSLHETLLHVPLVARGPRVPVGVHEETVSLLGLHAGILEILSNTPRAGSLFSAPEPGARSEYESARHQVRALDGFLRGRSVPEATVPRLATAKGASAHRGSYKAVASGGELEVFDLVTDPQEARPLSGPLPAEARAAADIAREGVEALERIDGRGGEEADLDEEIRAHLEALGYL